MFSGLDTFWRIVVISGLLEPLECRTAQMCQMFRYGWRPSHGDTRYSFELAFQCHRFEVNPTVRSEVMHVLLKSGQSISRERAVEEMKERRSTVHPWCR